MAGPAYALALSKDTVGAGRRYALPPANRVLYVLAGGAAGATVLRWELLDGGAAPTRGPST